MNKLMLQLQRERFSQRLKRAWSIAHGQHKLHSIQAEAKEEAGEA